MLQETAQTDFSRDAILRELQKGPRTYGYGALSIWDRHRVNQLLLLAFIKKSLDRRAYQPISDLIPIGTLGSLELADIVLGPPLLSFVDSGIQDSKATITLPLLGGQFIERTKQSAHIVGFRQIQAIDGGQIQLTVGLNGSKIDTQKFSLTIQFHESQLKGIEFPEMSPGLKEACERYLSSWVRKHRMEYTIGELNLKPPGNTLTLEDITIRTQKHPRDTTGGAVVAFIQSNYDRNDQHSLPARDQDFPWLIPEGSTCAVLFSHKVLMRDLLRPKLMEQLGITADQNNPGLALTPADRGFDKLVAQKGEYNTEGFISQKWREVVSLPGRGHIEIQAGSGHAVGQKTGIPLRYTPPESGAAFTVLLSNTGNNILYQWGRNTTENPDTTNYPLQYWCNTVYIPLPPARPLDVGPMDIDVGPMDNKKCTGTLKFNYNNTTDLKLAENGPIISFSTGTPKINTWMNLPVPSGMDINSGNWDRYVNRPIKPPIENNLKSQLRPLQGLQLNSIKLLAETHLFGPYGMQLKSVHLPGDIALFGDIDPKHTAYYIEPSYLPVALTQTAEFRLHPTSTSPSQLSNNVQFKLKPNLGTCRVDGTKLTYRAPDKDSVVKTLTHVQLMMRYTKNQNQYEASALIQLLPSPIFLNHQIDLRPFPVGEADKKITYQLDTLQGWGGSPTTTQISWALAPAHGSFSNKLKSSIDYTVPTIFPDVKDTAGKPLPIAITTLTATAKDPSFQGEWSTSAQIVLLHSECRLFFQFYLKDTCPNQDCQSQPNQCTHRDRMSIEAGQKRTLSSKKQGLYAPDTWAIDPTNYGSLSAVRQNGDSCEVTYTAPTANDVKTTQNVIVYAWAAADPKTACGYGVIEVRPKQSTSLISQGFFHLESTVLEATDPTTTLSLSS